MSRSDSCNFQVVPLGGIPFVFAPSILQLDVEMGTGYPEPLQ